jgi:hypothetical protein
MTAPRYRQSGQQTKHLTKSRNSAYGATRSRLACCAGLIATLTGPSQFWHETRSVLLTAERRDRIAAGEAAAAMVRLRRLPLEDAGAGIDGAVLDLATTHRLSDYDMTPLISRSQFRGSCRSQRSRSDLRPRRSLSDRNPRSAGGSLMTLFSPPSLRAFGGEAGLNLESIC